MGDVPLAVVLNRSHSPRSRTSDKTLIIPLSQVAVRDTGSGALRRGPGAAAASLPLPLLLRRGGGGVPRPRQARPPHAGAPAAPSGARSRPAPLAHSKTASSH